MNSDWVTLPAPPASLIRFAIDLISDTGVSFDLEISFSRIAMGALGFPSIFVLLVRCLHTVGQSSAFVVGLTQRWQRPPSYCDRD
jgi:hypothetical protein